MRHESSQYSASGPICSGRGEFNMQADDESAADAGALPECPEDLMARTIATHAAEPLFLLDAENRITFGNPAAERTFGWSLKEMRGKALRDLVGCSCGRGEVCPRLTSIQEKVPNSPITEPPYEASMSRKDGTRLEVVCSHSPIVEAGAAAGGVLIVRDVTAQRRAERRTLELSRRLEAYLTNSPLAVVEFAPDQTITRWNPEAERLFGWTAGEIVGRSAADCPWAQPERPVLTPEPGSASPPATTRSHTKDGRIVEIEWRHSQLLDADGKLLSALSLGLDVSERVSALNALRESEELFRSTMQHAPVGIAHLDMEGHFLLVNEELCRMLGYSAQEFVGRTVQQITHPDDFAWEQPNARALIEGQIPSYSREKRYIRKDGTIIWVIVRSSLLHDAAGNPTFVVAVVSDITERKRADEWLRRSRDQYRFLADSMSQMVFSATPDGRADYGNRRWLDYAGQPLDPALSPGWAPVIHPEDRQDSSALWRNCVKTGAPYQIETRVRRADGEYRWHLVRATALRDEDGGIIQWVGACTDIEDQKQAEAELESKIRERTAEALEQARRAEEASLAKSEFLATMSHEIRSPINVIVGLADLLWESKLPDQEREYTRVLRKAGETLMRVIDDILDLSAVEARRLSVEHVSFELGAVLDTVLAILLPRAKGRGLQLVCEVEAGIPKPLAGDPNRLHQVLVNLLGNAMKFTEKGSVALRVQQSPGGAPGTLTFSVADTGIGIPADKQALIFEPFTQADSSTTRKYGGTGLGLTISRGLVERMGGRMWVESEPGRGSTFSFTIPFGIPAEQVPEAPLGYHAQVLIVDDSDANRMILRQTLAPYVDDAAEAASGEEGLAKLEAAESGGRPVTLALVDSRMPFMSGADFIREARRRGFTGVTFAVLSSEGGDEERSRYREIGVGLYFTKPLRKGEILSVIRTLPAEAVPAEPAPKAALDAAPGPPRRILLADDSADNVFLIQAFLKGSEYSVEVASDGAEAVAKVQAGGYDLVLMDIQMPVLDGHAATRAIRSWESENRRRPLPVLALTAHALQSEVDKSLEAGCNAHLSKPIQRAALLAALSRFSGERTATRIVATAPEGLEDLSRRYLAKRQEGLPALRELVEAGEYRRVRELAHDIKGTGLGYGFPPLTDAARELEAAAAGSDLEHMRNALLQMEEYVSAVEIEPGG